MKRILYVLFLLFLGFQNLANAQTVTVTAPNGSEIWPACATRTISWAASSTSGYYNVDYSTNGGTTWASIATFLNATSLNWTVPNVQSTNCLIRVYDSYNNLVVDQSNAVFTINAAVRVTAPNGGESWQVGNPATQQITWVASGTGTYLTIEYSIDAGNSWNTVTTSALASAGSYTWSIPNTPSSQCLVRIKDNNTPCMSDVSDALFTIVAPTPSITVTSPNTAVTWYVGYSNNIQWTSQYVTNPFVAIDYSTDGGTTWTAIVTSTNNSGSYSWTVPNTPSSQCKVRVKDASNPAVNDISNVNFTIAIPVWTITVTSPNGGETWNSCSTYNIGWNNTFVTGNYKIEYSTDNGASWNTVANNVTASPYSWTVPNNIATSNQCLIKVSSVTNPAVYDVSNATFTINQFQYIVITSPNGGENWQVGNPATRQITWVYNGTTTNFRIEYSTDNGATWTVINSNYYAPSSPASYTWTLPNTPSTQCLVKISDYSSLCRTDVSDNVFIITPPTPTITVTNPNTAVTWYVGSTYSINWSSQYVTNPYVSIEYSTDGGTTWTTIVATTNNNGSYSWTVPNTPTTQARIRVSDASSPSTNDISNVNFTIAVPVSSITVSSPNGGETWNSCTNYNISWTVNNVTGNYKIEYSTNGGSTWNTITTSAASSPYTWTVPNNIATSNQCLIRVSSVSNPAITDISNATFTINQVQYIIVTSPNGGENWQVGNPATRQITWVYNGTSTNFRLEYSYDNGVTWNLINANYYAPSSPASYTWTVPNTPGTQCFVRVMDYSVNCRADDSDLPFTIQAPTPTITVTSPNTAVTWYVGYANNITWNTSYVTDPFVAIDYSTDNGTTWTNIVSAINTSLGTYAWTVPNTPSTQCLVKVRSTATPTTYDVSNVNFTIATPVWTINVTSPNGGESWNSCTNYNISWSNNFVTGNYKIEYSTDNGTTWNTITNNAGSSPYTWPVPNNIPTSNQCLIKVSSITNPSVFDISNAVFTINQVPYVVVTSPTGGDNWQVGNPTTRQITWVYNGTSTNFRLEYSYDNGVTWNLINANYYAPSSPASYTWTVPNTPGTQCFVRVMDYSSNCKSDDNDLPFTIQAPTPTITVTSPNTAVTWYVGYANNITWNTAYVNDPYVAIDYSTDGGSTWTNIVASLNTSLGTYSWTVPNTPSTQCLVKVRSTTTPTTYDVSNVNFTIATPVWTINVTSPNGGESWNSCTNYNISWNNSFVTGNYKLEYSTNNGATWNTITNNAGSSPYTWTVPNNIPTSNQCLIKVSSITNPSVFDISNAVFTINQVPYVVVTSPTGGDNWQVGNPTTRQITWVYNGTSTNFRLEYSYDNGVTWNLINANYYAPSSPASYTWTVPNTPGTQCFVRVMDYSSNCKSDDNDLPFTIQAPTPTITVTSPNTAVTWYVGYANNITWNIAYVNDPYVAIDYSIDNGSTWTNIASSLNASLGTYSWTVPNTPSTQCLVKVRSTTTPTTYDVSNVNFTIATPVWTINVTSPNGGESWNSCTNYNISWNNSFVTGNYKIEYSTNNGTTWNTITNNAGSSPYTWTVPNNIPTSNQCLIKVSSITNPSVFDISNAVFTINQVPYIVVTSPTGGDNWQVGNPTTRQITWAYNGTSTNFRLEYSYDNGLTWNLINANYYAPSSPASYTWTVPNTPGNQCFVRVMDYSSNCKSDDNDVAFIIQAPTPTITVTSPNTSVIWGVGGNYNITWSSQYVTSPFVAIDYSTDGGSTWTNIVSSINTSLGTYTWTVPNTVSNQCRVRVRDNTNPGTFDISNVNFSIVPAITLTSPNGGENWGGCTVSSVTWTAYGTSGQFKIEYSLDNGQNWTIMNSSYAAAGPNCTYTWTIPHSSSSSCIVRVSDAAALTKTDVSNNVFTIFPAIVVTNPNTSIGVFAGQNINITWTSTGTSNYYNIDYSINGGTSWTNIVFNTLITTNSYSWTVPSTLSTNCLVRVTDYQNNCKQDVSDGMFTIAASASNVIVTVPNGSENWIACGTQPVQWSAQGTSGTYNIDYSINGGSSWTSIVSNYASASSNCTYNWTIPNTLSSNCLIRVTDAANSSRTDQSNAVFSISPFSINATAALGAVCAGSGTTITATGASSYTWQPGNLTGSSVSVTPSANTTYTVTGTQGTCSATTTVPITVIALPTVAATASPSTVCQNGSVTLNASGASSYTWSPANSLNVANIQSPTATPSVTTTYTVTGTSNGCSNTGTVMVTVSSSQSVSASASQSNICIGNNVTLTGTGAANYTWMPGNLTGSSVTVTPSATTTYTMTGTTGTCTNTATVTINVGTAPSVNATASQSNICAGSNVSLSATGATTYTWMPGNLTGSTVTVNPSVTTTYTVSGTNGGCSDTATVTIMVNPVPTVTTSGNINVCSGNSATITASGASSYTWMPGNINGSSITITPSASTTYTVTGTNPSGCTSTATVSATVAPSPTVTVTGTTTICAGGNTTLTAAGATSYVWQPGNLTGAAISIAPSATTTYTVSGTTGSCTVTHTVTVTVNPLPTVTAGASQTTVCSGTNVTLTSGGASTYNWQPGNLNGISVSVTPTATTTYTVTGTNGSCSSTATVTVNVQAAPSVSVSGTTSLCAGSSTTLTASGATSYTWQPGNMTTSSVTVTPASTTTYTVTGSNGTCTNTATVTVNVQAVPTVSISGQNAICTGNSTTLTASGATTYTWQPGNFPGSSFTAAPSSATTYTVTGTTGSCSSTQTVTVTVAPTPTVTATASQSTVCGGSQTTLTASGASSYTWMPGNLTGSSVTVTPSSTTTYTVTGVNGSCSSTQTVTITVNSVIALSVSGGPPICAGNNTTLTASGASTYTWQPGNLTGSSVTVSPASTTTYTVTGTAGSCSGTQTITVTVNSVPVVTATGTGSICAGGSAQLTASGAASYTWMPGNLNSSTAVVSPSTATTYTVTGTSSNGCTATATVSVGVNPLPAITASGGGTVCAGSLATLSASGGVSYTWQPGSLTGPSVNVTPASTTTYVVTGVNASGCSATASVTVTVAPSPTVNASGPANTCAGNNITLSATGASTYTWQPGNITGSSVTVSPTATTSYVVTGTSVNGCTSNDTVVVAVTAAPVVNATAQQSSLCSGGSTTLTASGANSFVWQPGNITGNTMIVAPTATTTYTVIGTNGSGCNDTATVTVTVNSTPVLAVTGGGTLCAGSTGTLTASGAVAYTWQPGNLNGASITVSPSSTTTYTVTGLSAAGCQATSTVTLNVVPAPIVIASGNSSICAGNNTTLNASGASTYSWQPGNLSGSSVSVSPASTTAYVVTGTDVNGCTSTDTVLVTVSAAPVVTASTSQGTLCPGGSATLSASGAGSYIWQPGNLTGSVVSVSPSTTTTYTVTGTNGNCSSTALVTVNVNPAPPVTITASSSTLCQGTSATLTAAGAASYVWSAANQTTAAINVSPSATTSYSVTGTDANGCTATASVTITVAPYPTVNAAASNATVCAGDAVTLTATGADIYTWQPGNVGGSAVTVNPTANTTYTVTGTNAAGCSNTGTVTVNVNPLPAVSFVLATDTVCQNYAPFALSGGSPAGGVYSGQGVVGGMFDPMTAGAGLHQVMYTYTDAVTGCDNTATQVIYVNPCTGVEEAADAIFSIFPNPVIDKVTIRYEDLAEPIRIDIFNTVGERMSTYQMNEKQFDISLQTYASGVYHLAIYGPKGVISKKIVKM